MTRTTICSILAIAASAPAATAATPTLDLAAYVYAKKTSGDTYSSHERLYQGARKVGEDYSRCVPASRSTVRCTGSYTLTHGTFRISGTISNTSDTNRLAISDGTGVYKDRRGTVLTIYNRAGTKAAETITFSRSS